MKKQLKNLLLMAATLFAFAGCETPQSITDAQKKEVVTSYAKLAKTSYEVALEDAKALKTAIDSFESTKNATTYTAMKTAWLKARESYGLTEAFRLSGGPIDADGRTGLNNNWVDALYGAPEGQINAWPLDENMIDYTVEANGSLTSGNIIDTEGNFTPSGDEATMVDVTTITKAKLAALNENGGEANVATGYHAIEFLLWGQDQDYNSFIEDNITNGAIVAGERNYTDYTSATHANRRMHYLTAAAELLVDDLTTVTDAWEDNGTVDCNTTGVGCYRAALLGALTGTHASKNIATDAALKQIMAGVGVFIKSELANERIAVAVLTPSEEDEHSCFSDNTHRDIAQNYLGFVNILKAQYQTTIGGTATSQGTSIYSLLNSTTKAKVDALVTSINTGVNDIDTTALTMHFDYQIKPNSGKSGLTQNIPMTKNDMRDLGDAMVDIAANFGLVLTANDVTDSEETVVK